MMQTAPDEKYSDVESQQQKPKSEIRNLLGLAWPLIVSNSASRTESRPKAFDRASEVKKGLLIRTKRAQTL